MTSIIEVHRLETAMTVIKMAPFYNGSPWIWGNYSCSRKNMWSPDFSGCGEVVQTELSCFF